MAIEYVPGLGFMETDPARQQFSVVDPGVAENVYGITFGQEGKPPGVDSRLPSSAPCITGNVMPWIFEQRDSLGRALEQTEVNYLLSLLQKADCPSSLNPNESTIEGLVEIISATGHCDTRMWGAQLCEEAWRRLNERRLTTEKTALLPTNGGSSQKIPYAPTPGLPLPPGNGISYPQQVAHIPSEIPAVPIRDTAWDRLPVQIGPAGSGTEGGVITPTTVMRLPPRGRMEGVLPLLIAAIAIWLIVR